MRVAFIKREFVTAVVLLLAIGFSLAWGVEHASLKTMPSRKVDNSRKSPITFTSSQRAEDVALAVVDGIRGERRHGRSITGRPEPLPFAPAAAINYVPNTFTDPSVSAPFSVRTSDGHIMNGASDTGVVSLRSAVVAANANVNINPEVDTITLGNGTYTLTIPAGVGLEPAQPGLELIGDLDVKTTGLTINGNGPANTTIQQTSGIDRVIDVNPPFALGNFFFTLNGVTITGGRSTSGDAGGLYSGSFDQGLPTRGKITLTNCVFKNNQVTNPGLGGGGFQNFGGDLEINNCTFGGVGGSDPNTAGTSGGGAAVLGAFTSSITTITNSTFTNNTASSLSSGGGGLDIANLNLGNATVTVDGCTFTGNQAAGTASGGGILIETSPTTIKNTTFTNNNAGNRAGGVYVGGGSLHLDGTTPITFTGNTAGIAAATSMSTASAVQVSGTQVAIGGSIEISTNGSWTNNVGSTLSPTNIIVVGGTLTMGNGSTMNVAGNLTFQANGVAGFTFNGNSGTVNIGGSLSTTGGGTTPVSSFSGGTGTFNFNGSGAQTISGSLSPTFFNLTDSNTTQALAINNSPAVNGTLNVLGAGATINPAAASIISGTGTLTGTGTVRVTRTAATAGFGNQYTITNKTLTNLTVDYVGGAAQVLTALTYGGLRINNGSGVTMPGNSIVNGQLTLSNGALGVGTNTLTLNGAVSLGAGTITSAAAGTVNYNQASGGQNVAVGSYGNLTFSNQNKVLPAGTVGIAGTFTPGTAVGHSITGNTIDFNGAGTQGIPAFNYNNLTVSGARGPTIITLINGGTIGIAGVFSPTATFTGAGGFANTGNTINFNGVGPQTIPAFNYFHLTSSNSGARTLANSGTIAVAATFSPGTNTYTITGSTINFNGTGAQTIPAFNYNNLTSSSTGTRVLAGAGVIGVAGAFTPGTNVYTNTGSTIDFNGSVLQTIPAFSYNHLTSSNTGARTLANAGTIGVFGNFTPGTNAYTITGSTINFNGTGSQNIPAFNYNNLTSSNTGARVLANTGTIGVAGAFTPGTNTYTNTGSTISYNGAAQSIAVFLYNNLSTAGSGIKSLTGATTVGGVLTIGTGTTLDVTATNFALNVGGNWTNNGTFTAQNGTVTLNGSAQQTVGGSSLTTFFNLILNNANGALLSQNVAVNGLLTLTSGSFNIGTNILTLNNGTSVGGGSLNGSLGTVNYNQGTNGQVVLAGQYNNLIFSNSNKVLPNGGTIGISGTFTPGGGVHTITGSTIDFNGTGPQTIPAFNYFNLTSSSTGARTLASVGTIGIASAFTPGTNVYTITGSTINFNGSGAQTIPAFSYNNLTSSNTGARTLASSGIVGVAGAFAPGTNVYTITGSTINFNGAGAQTIPAFNYNNLMSSSTGARTLANTGVIRVASVFTPGANAYTVTGSTVEYNGSSPQTQPATAFTYHNLTINNPAGVTLSANATVNQDLLLNNGNVTTGVSNTIFVGGAGNVVRTAGHVVGNLEKAFTGPITFTFQVGTTAYTPVIAVVTAGSGQLRVRANDGVPVVAPVPLDSAKTLQRFFTLSGSGVTSNISFTYVDADVPATTSESLWNVIRVTGNTVVRYPPGPNIIFNTGANIFTVNGLTTYSDWTAGEPLAPTAANVGISGRVTDGAGRGVAGAVISMQGQSGNVVYAVTNPFGYYRFAGVETGQTYLIAPRHKRFTFEPRSISVIDNVVGLDFIASP